MGEKEKDEITGEDGMEERKREGKSGVGWPGWRKWE